jgi:hypothetical protein
MQVILCDRQGPWQGQAGTQCYLLADPGDPQVRPFSRTLQVSSLGTDGETEAQHGKRPYCTWRQVRIGMKPPWSYFVPLGCKSTPPPLCNFFPSKWSWSPSVVGRTRQGGDRNLFSLLNESAMAGLRGSCALDT